MLNAKTALFQANLLYGIELSDNDFEEYFLIIHKMIGNKNTRIYHYITHINPEDLSIDLPCNCDQLEGVFYNWEDFNYTSNKAFGNEYNSHYTEQYIESRKHFTDPLYHHGKYAEYHRAGDKLYFKHNHGKIHILYKGELLDDEGLPFINDKEAMAIATYIAYIVKYKEALTKNNAQMLQFSQELYKKALQFMDEARTPEYVSQNDMDEILEVKSSWNRKVHNKSYKPLI